MNKTSVNKVPGDDFDDDELDPRSQKFCRACIDESVFSKSKPTRDKQAQCPPDTVQLGRATWTFLHSMAAYYPERPTVEQQCGMSQLMKQFADFYPCGHCAADLQKNLAKFPPKVETRGAFAGWLCLQHNLVNAKLGKPLFDCSLVEERWKTGWKDGSCDLE